MTTIHCNPRNEIYGDTLGGMLAQMTANVSYPGAIPPPPGVTPDLEHPHSGRQTLAMSVAITCIVLASLFFFTRAYVKLRIIRIILAEDGMYDAR